MNRSDLSKGLDGEKLVGGLLDRLGAYSWNVLHSVPLPNGADIDHVVIWPPGVFAVNTSTTRTPRPGSATSGSRSTAAATRTSRSPSSKPAGLSLSFSAGAASRFRPTPSSPSWARGR
ncbi:nuclease-related domain-containing protein [Kitasatospora purpeofusca]|uniref:nuclease-related domain-containing protein n=1 Tax=Kitasatospora purpeofusca TaxID=67352 RepID=UPI0033FB9E3C